MALTENKYRTFDEVLDSVKLDLYTWDLEGLINTQQLLKVIIRVNYDLGLRIQEQKSRTIEIIKNKGRLPQNFDVLNFALVCEDRITTDIPTYNKTYSEGMLEGILLSQNFLEPRFVNESVTLTTINQGVNIINHQLHTQSIIVQAFAPDGTMLDFDVTIIDPDNIQLISEATENILNVKVVVMGAKIHTVGTGSGSCPALLDCNESGTPKVYYTTNGRRTESKNLVPLHMTKAESLSPDYGNMQGRHDRMDDTYITGKPKRYENYYDGYLKNGFLHTVFDEGVVYLNYQSTMEDDDGNLLTLDHPYCNEYYEYALKQRIYENLFMSGEQVQNHLQLMEGKLKAARNVALSFVNTPDFAEMRKLHDINRKAQYHNFYNMFKSSTN